MTKLRNFLVMFVFFVAIAYGFIAIIPFVIMCQLASLIDPASDGEKFDIKETTRRLSDKINELNEKLK